LWNIKENYGSSMKLGCVGVKWSKKFHSIPTFFHIYSNLTILTGVSGAIIFPSEDVARTKIPLSLLFLFGIRRGIQVSIPSPKMGF